MALMGHQLMGLTLVGLVLRRNHRACRSFGVYLAAVLGFELLAVAWPERFFTRTVWTLQESLFALLKVAILAEITCLTFQRLPRALTTAKLALAATGVTGLVTMLGPPLDMEYTTIVARLLPHAMTLTAWLFTTFAVLALWYRVPLHPLHRRILWGLIPYLALSGMIHSMLTIGGWQLLELTNYLEPLAYLGALAWWVWAAWQPRDDQELSDAVRLLQPWRA